MYIVLGIFCNATFCCVYIRARKSHMIKRPDWCVAYLLFLQEVATDHHNLQLVKRSFYAWKGHVTSERQRYTYPSMYGHII